MKPCHVCGQRPGSNPGCWRCRQVQAAIAREQAGRETRRLFPDLHERAEEMRRRAAGRDQEPPF